MELYQLLSIIFTVSAKFSYGAINSEFRLESRHAKPLVHAGGGGLPSGHTHSTIVVWGYLAHQVNHRAMWIFAGFLIVLIPQLITMLYYLLADFVVLIHFAFVLFSVLGAMLTIWWRKVIWLHLPAAIWAAWIEFSGGICPLTPLENWLRMKGGDPGYTGDFMAHYILPVLYPSGLTREIQMVLGAIVVAVNMGIYGYVIFFRKPKEVNFESKSRYTQ